MGVKRFNPQEFISKPRQAELLFCLGKSIPCVTLYSPKTDEAFRHCRYQGINLFKYIAYALELSANLAKIKAIAVAMH